MSFIDQSSESTLETLSGRDIFHTFAFSFIIHRRNIMELQNIDIGNVLVSVTGLSLNMLTIISLLMMRSTRQVLGMLTWSLVLALSASDLLITGFFLPLKVWNHVVGDCWPFSVSGVCLLIEFMWILVAAVAWLLVMVAVVRTIAVFAPLFFRKCAENVWFRVVLVVVGYFGMLGGFLTGFYSSRSSSPSVSKAGILSAGVLPSSR